MLSKNISEEDLNTKQSLQKKKHQNQYISIQVDDGLKRAKGKDQTQKSKREKKNKELLKIATVDGRIANWKNVDKINELDYMDFDQNLKEQVDIILKQKKKMGSKISQDINKKEEPEISSSDDS